MGPRDIILDPPQSLSLHSLSKEWIYPAAVRPPPGLRVGQPAGYPIVESPKCPAVMRGQQLCIQSRDEDGLDDLFEEGTRWPRFFTLLSQDIWNPLPMPPHLPEVDHNWCPVVVCGCEEAPKGNWTSWCWSGVGHRPNKSSTHQNKTTLRLYSASSFKPPCCTNLCQYGWCLKWRKWKHVSAGTAWMGAASLI